MAKSSNRRRARAELERHVAIAQRFFKAGKQAEAIGPLSEAARLAPDNGGLFNDLGLAYLGARRLPEALDSLRRAAALLPNVGRVHHNLGRVLEATGDAEAAIVEYRRALALSPDLAKAHGRLADLLLKKGLRSEACASYERAAQCEPGTPFGRLCKAQALNAEGRHGDAADELRQLVASDPSNAKAHWQLGSFLQEAGLFTEATACFERSIALAPWESSAYYGLVSARRFTEADRPRIAQIVSRLETKDGSYSPGIDDRHRMTLHFAAGKALDDVGDYADAMRHFSAANEIHRKGSMFDRDAVERLVERLIARFTRQFFADHAAMGGDDPTPILVVGMPRSGSTLVERIVSSHPAVRGCGELDFWSQRGPEWSTADAAMLGREAERLRVEYLQVLRRGAPDALRATDKMPFNFFWIGLLHLLFPNARFVHTRRNPLDTCLSIYTTPLGTIRGFPSGLDDLAWYYPRYVRLMDHWRAVLPDRLIDVDYERVVAEPEEIARRLIAFSGLPWDPACSRPDKNADAIRTSSNWQARQPVYGSSVERWRRYEPWIGELRALLPAK